jgi:glycosyltransferase involved in cell wall biosynthesis
MNSAFKPKPVLGMVLKGYPRISETFISNEILLLERLGIQVRLFPMRHPRENFSHASVKKIQARVDYLPTHLWSDLHVLLFHNILLAFKKPRVYGRVLALTVRRLLQKRKIATVKHLFQAGYMVNRFLSKSPEIKHIHSHFAHSPTSVTMFASMLSGLPFSFTAHAKDIYTSNPQQIKEKIDLASFVVTCTRYNKEYLTNISKGSNTPIHCVYHGIDVQLFSETGGGEKAAKAPYSLLTVARMTEKKGLPTIYAALKILQDKGIAFNHTLVGDGDDRDDILNLIRQLGLEKSCHWAGTRTHEEVLQFFRDSDLFVLGCEIAKNGDRDGIPNVLVESLAMEVPAVSTTVSGVPEILENNTTGLTVPPSDPERMALAMRDLLTDEGLRAQIKEGGRQKVIQEFDNRIHIDVLAELYRKALA